MQNVHTKPIPCLVVAQQRFLRTDSDEGLLEGLEKEFKMVI